MVKLYVEGGGDSSHLKAACREGFSTFITKSEVRKRPRIVACGSRRDAYKSYCTAIANGEDAILLVDSEAPVADEYQQGQDKEKWNPWGHLKQRKGDSWEKPDDVADTDCHLMVQCMETWLVADREVLAKFFSQGFRESALPAVEHPIEQVAKQQIYDSLKGATRDCKSGPYGKGSHSFKILKEISPDEVSSKSPWALRFIEEIKKKLDR